MTFWRILFILAFSTHQIKGQIDPPKLDPGEGQQVINTNETWEITCSGSKPLKWAFANNETYDRIRTVFNQEAPYESTVRLVNANYMDTGQVSCYYQEVRKLI